MFLLRKMRLNTAWIFLNIGVPAIVGGAVGSFAAFCITSSMGCK